MVNGNNEKVSVLIYKHSQNCPKYLVEIPIIKKHLPIQEFTFCGRYNFKYLKDSVLMNLEQPLTYLRIMNFEEKMGILYHEDAGHFFYFPNQTIMPDQWQFICLARYLKSMKVVLNGEIVFDSTANSIGNEKSSDADKKLYLGGQPEAKLKHRRFEGIITDAHFWNTSLKIDDITKLTSVKSKVKAISSSPPPLFSLDSFKANPITNNECFEQQILNENDEIFKDELHGENINLIEFLTTFESANYLCHAFGGKLLVPQKNETLDKISTLIEKSEECFHAFIGLKKVDDESDPVDLQGNSVPFARWKKNEPNGKDYEKCISIGQESKYVDISCFEKQCFLCEMTTKNIFSLRGKIPAIVDRNYVVSMATKDPEIRGFKNTQCFWKNNTWHFGPTLKQDHEQDTPFFKNMPPVGLQKWNEGQMLKFTQCKLNEFTCYDYGHCIPLDKRCDGHPDCTLNHGSDELSLDDSDEDKCSIMTLQGGYNEKYPPGRHNVVYIDLEVHDILDINELDGEYKIFLKVKLTWYDSRITFRNLKANYDNNKLKQDEIGKIWTPQLLFEHSDSIGFIKAGQELSYLAGDLSQFSGTGIVRVNRNGKSPLRNSLEEVNEDYLYLGKENAITMTNYMAVRIGCEFNLKMYPFDTQSCPIELIKTSEYDPQFVLKWQKPPIIKKITLIEYEVMRDLEFNNTNSTQNRIIVHIKLQRILWNHIYNTYIPTFCLVTIATSTLFIDESHFEATIMVALTSMLVIYTLHQSISANLPLTSYMKMIDIWLFCGLIVPFIVIGGLIILDYMILKESNQITEMNANKKSKWNSKTFLKCLQIILPLTTWILGLIYWIVGLGHYLF